MPIKKHILKVEKLDKKLYMEIPETICSALGINNDSVVKVYSNNDRYSFTVETMLSFENVCMLERLKDENIKLKEELKSVNDALEENIRLKEELNRMRDKWKNITELTQEENE